MIGNKVKHIKTGGTYLIVATAMGDTHKFEDGSQGYLIPGTDPFAFELVTDTASWLDLRLPVLVQVSDPQKVGWREYLVYQSLENHMLFARRSTEFTGDRFEAVS